MFRFTNSGNDIGGCEGLIDVVSATDGLVVSAGGMALPEYSDAPFYKPHGDYDYVYVIDAQGWFYRYAHLKSIDLEVQPGKRVRMGQKIGVLGKEGSSGGWAHLHFDIKARQPSGKWGIQDAYAFLWEAYIANTSPTSSPSPGRITWHGRRQGYIGRLALVEFSREDQTIRMDFRRRRYRAGSAGRAPL